nr:hypothetical protein [Caballeronia sp. LZ065]
MENPFILPARHRDNDVVSLPSAGLEEAVQANLIKQDFRKLSSLCHHPPRQLLVGVEIEHKAIGVLKIRLNGVPGMQFDDVHLRKADQRFMMVDG